MLITLVILNIKNAPTSCAGASFNKCERRKIVMTQIARIKLPTI